MIEQLPAMDQPDWLSRIDGRNLGGPFPLQSVLQGSLYYPASGFHGDPVRYLAGNFFSFVYVDYGLSRNDLMSELQTNGFRGYEVIGQRHVSEEELTPRGWTPVPPRRNDGDPMRYSQFFQPPFCEWMIFQRAAGYNDDHGPSRFSLVHLCADGVAAFQALYVSNRLRPGGIAIIQPGHAYGLNWTNFTDENGPLARVVLGNPVGKPDILLYGGMGGRDLYDAPCWTGFDRLLGYLGNTSISLWRYGSRDA